MFCRRAITSPSVQFNRSQFPIQTWKFPITLVNAWRLPLFSRWLCTANTTPSVEFNRIFKSSKIIPMFWILKTYLNPIIVVCCQNKPQRRRHIEYLVLPQHSSCCEFLLKTAAPWEKSFTVSFRKTSPSKWKCMTLDTNPSKVCEPAPALVCDIDHCVICRSWHDLHCKSQIKIFQDGQL